MAILKEEKRKYCSELAYARRNAYLQLYGPCKYCGSWENLEFHHRDPKLKKRNINWLHAKKKRLEEIIKCDILCHNCHLSVVPLVHGTYSGYFRGCRCVACSKAMKIYQHKIYLRRKAQKKVKFAQ